MNNNMNKYILLVFLFGNLSFFGQNKEIKLNSPSENLVVKVLNDTKGLNLALINSKKEIIDIDLKGFVFESGLDFNNYEISNTSKSMYTIRIYCLVRYSATTYGCNHW